jgi:HK97 gp10 family phage protein
MARIISTRLVDHSDEAIRAMEEAIEAALTACGMKAEEYAKRELNGDFGAPRRIDTGRLRASVANKVVKSENVVYVGTNVEYGPYVHEGTDRMAPNRFLRNAVERHRDEYNQIIKDAMK